MSTQQAEVKTMLALFVPEGFTDEWATTQMNQGGFDKLRDVIQITGYETGDDDARLGIWLMQEMISRVH